MAGILADRQREMAERQKARKSRTTVVKTPEVHPVSPVITCIKCGTEHPISIRCPAVDSETADKSYLNKRLATKRKQDEVFRTLHHPSSQALSVRLDLKQRAIKHMGGKCQICGYNRCPRAMEFHHLDPEKKSFSISSFITGHTYDVTADYVEQVWGAVEWELRKCVLLCSNCHREVESGVTELKGTNGS
jgi:5-methylcytosine-specific restriction endonuclease McrA